jgi:WD40 repeat protein
MCQYHTGQTFDGDLLASTSRDDTIKLWAFESRQLLASFHILPPDLVIFSPNSRQLVYTSYDDICTCNIPPSILASIRPAAEVQSKACITLLFIIFLIHMNPISSLTQPVILLLGAVNHRYMLHLLPLSSFGLRLQ